MAINVYWTCIEDEWIRSSEPEVVTKLAFNRQMFLESSAFRCPAIRNYLKNTFALKSLYEYEFEIEKDRVKATNYDQIFFDKHVSIRSIENKLFSFLQSFIFFTDVDSLEFSFLQPFLEENNVNERCILFPGKIDIAKWYRTTDFAFKLKDKYNSFKIEENEIFAYVQFHTNEKINFINYRFNDKLKSLCYDILNSKNYQNSNVFRNLEYRYKLFKTKKIILKEIKDNII